MDDEKRTPEGGSENNELKDIEAHHDDARPSSPDDEVAQQTHLDRDHPTHDPDVVDWDGSSDVQNPRNWATWKKLTNVGVIVFMTLLTPLASSMFAPAVPQVLEEFHNHADAIPELVVSIYILGFGIGPLIISPLSEIYGRWPVYFVTNILFMVFTVACAVATSMPQLIVFRFLAGCAGAAPVTLGGATIADVTIQEKRGFAMSLFSLGPLIGPVIGPVGGSFLAAAEGWRWTFWLITIVYGTCTIAHVLLCRETFSVVLLARKTQKLRTATGNQNLRSAQDDGLTPAVRMQRAMVRPLKMLMFSPIVFAMAIYIAFLYGVLYLLYTTFTFVFTQSYGFSSSTVGLVYIGNGIGNLIGLMTFAFLSDRLLTRKASAGDGELKPEYRLIIVMYLGWLAPAGLFIYGWTAYYEVHWVVPIFGTLLFGLAIIAALISVQQYVVDAYTLYAASGIAALTILRSVLGGVLPLCGLKMYAALNLGWGNSLIAFVALAMVPVPWGFYYFGERLRKGKQLQL